MESPASETPQAASRIPRHRSAGGVVTVLISLASLVVAIIALHEAHQRDQRAFGISMHFNTDASCPEINTFTIGIVNTSQRPVTISSIVLTKPGIGATIAPRVVREVHRRERRHWVQALVVVHPPLPATLDDGRIVEVTYALDDVVDAPKSDWPTYVEVEDADDETRSLPIDQDFAGVAQTLGATPWFMRKTCRVPAP